MSSIPPKQTPDPSAYEASEPGGGLVAMYNAASHAGGDSFPVLKAFQDYIEAERSQARKRVMQLSIFFAVLMCVVVTGFLIAGIFMLRNMTTVQGKLLDVALAQREAPAPVAPAPILQAPPVAQPSPVLEESVRQMSRATTELQSSMDRKLDGVSEIATKVHEKVASQDGELVKMRDELRAMQEQSAKLKDELVSIKESEKKAAVAAAQQRAYAAAHPRQPPAVSPAVSAPAVAAAPAAPASLTVRPPLTTPSPIAADPAIPEARNPRFPPAVKDPPVTPAGVTPPPAPQGMMATAMPLKTKNVGTIPWRVLIPE
jgi:hypothetical protein